MVKVSHIGCSIQLLEQTMPAGSRRWEEERLDDATLCSSRQRWMMPSSRSSWSIAQAEIERRTTGVTTCGWIEPERHDELPL